MKTLTREKQTERATQGITSSTLLPVAMVVVFVLLASAKSASTKQLFTDSAINSTVGSDPHFEMTVFAKSPDTGTGQNIAALSGSLDNFPVKRMGTKSTGTGYGEADQAASTGGVREVISRLKVR